MTCIQLKMASAFYENQVQTLRVVTTALVSRVPHLISCSLVLGKALSMAWMGVSARSRPSTWCWLKVAILTLGLRVMCPTVGSRVPEMRFSRVDFPMPAERPIEFNQVSFRACNPRCSVQGLNSCALAWSLPAT